MKTLRNLFLLFIFAVLCFAGFLGGAFLWLRDMSAPAPTKKECKIFVSPGSNTRQIAAALKKHDVIRSTLLFSLYIRFLAVDHRLRPGSYSFSPGETLNQVIFKLLQGTRKSTYVTIPEGTTNKEVAAILQSAGICNAGPFLEAASNPLLTGKIFSDWDLVPAGEGLLFPDTYNFNRPTPARKVAEQMLKLTRHQIDRIFADQELLQGLTPYQGCILASIIEKEAVKNDDRPKIASVFLNRLKKGIKLESCATVLYAHGTHKKRLLYEDLKIDSPYNTYLQTGLPPTPISNFGAASLHAVANPAETDFLYFVSDGKQGHRFSKTLKGHNKNKSKYLRQMKRKN